MERQDGCPSARLQSIRQLCHEIIEHLILVIDVNAQCLEHAGTALADQLLAVRQFSCLCARQPDFLQGPLNRLMQLPRRADGCTALLILENLPCNLFGIRFIGIFTQHADEFIAVHLCEAVSSRNACLRIQAQVKRTIRTIRKAALRIVDLHGRDAEIGENKVKRPHLLHELVNLTEIHLTQAPLCVRISLGADARLRLARFNRIDIAAVEMTFPLELLQHGHGMAAVTQRGIEALLARLDGQHVKDLPDHDGDMRARRRIALGPHMRNLLSVTLRIEFLVFLRKMARIAADVMDAALVGLWCRLVCHHVAVLFLLILIFSISHDKSLLVHI